MAMNKRPALYFYSRPNRRGPSFSVLYNDQLQSGWKSPESPHRVSGGQNRIENVDSQAHVADIKRVSQGTQTEMEIETAHDLRQISATLVRLAGDLENLHRERAGIDENCSTESTLFSDNRDRNPTRPYITFRPLVINNPSATSTPLHRLSTATAQATYSPSKRKADELPSDDADDHEADARQISKKQKEMDNMSQGCLGMSLEEMKRRKIDEAIELSRQPFQDPSSSNTTNNCGICVENAQPGPSSETFGAVTTAVSLVDSHGINGKTLGRRVKPVPSTATSGRVRDPHVFPFLELPVEIQEMILRLSLTINDPIQPTELIVANGYKITRLKYKDRSRLRQRRFLDLDLALLRTCKYMNEIGRSMLFSNTIDFSGTEVGAMTVRKFRRAIGIRGPSLVRNVVIHARMFEPLLFEQDGRFYTPAALFARRKADKILAERLRDGDLLPNIARCFRQLESLEIRMNELEWIPDGKVHFDLFGPHFRNLCIYIGRSGTKEEELVGHYNASGVNSLPPRVAEQDDEVKEESVGVSVA